MAIKRVIFLILGLICLALGTVGVFLPILPTVPFYMATVFKPSKKKIQNNETEASLEKSGLAFVK